jgi:hypothetical protein
VVSRRSVYFLLLYGFVLIVFFTIIRKSSRLLAIREAQRLGLLCLLVRREIEKHFADFGLEPEFVLAQHHERSIWWSKSEDRPWCCQMASSSNHVSR